MPILPVVSRKPSHHHHHIFIRHLLRLPGRESLVSDGLLGTQLL